MVWVYILQSKLDQGFYLGITKDIENRLKKHNFGKVRSTKNRRPFEVVYTEMCENYEKARNREIEIKSYKGGNEFRKLIK